MLKSIINYFKNLFGKKTEENKNIMVEAMPTAPVNPIDDATTVKNRKVRVKGIKRPKAKKSKN
jgi:hypothetical protein